MGSKKIMHLIATNFYGGPEKQIVEHLLRLNRISLYEGILGSFLEGGRKNELLGKTQEAGIQSFGIPMRNPFDIKALFILAREVREKKVSLLCTHHYKAVVMGWLVAKWYGIPVLNYSRGFTAENRKIAFYEWLERLFVRRMDGIISVALGQKKRLEGFGINHPKHWVVHNGVRIEFDPNSDVCEIRKRVFKRFNIPADGILAITVGRLSPEKGHRYLLNAIARTDFHRNNTYYLFCGNGVCRDNLEVHAKSLGVSEVCRFVGFRRDMHEIYPSIDFLILPSLTEGLPNVVLEAFSYAKPVLATAVGGVPEIIIHGENGFIVPKQNVEVLALYLNKLIKNYELRKKMGMSGYQRVKSEFTFDRQTEKLLQIYQKFLYNLEMG